MLDDPRWYLIWSYCFAGLATAFWLWVLSQINQDD